MDYALVISTNAGLWRYLIGDLVRFVDIRDPRIIISGRIKQFLSLCGEHLSLDNINQGLNLLNQNKVQVASEFTISVDKVQQCHHWYFEVLNPNDDPNLIMKELDEYLCALNDDYASARKVNLKKRGFNEVYQIEGGIVRYGEKFGDSGLWEGSLYTFDARKTIDFTESSKLIGECDFCTAPTKNFVNCANDFCHNQYLICGNCLNDPGNLECTHSDAKSSNKMKG